MGCCTSLLYGAASARRCRRPCGRAPSRSAVRRGEGHGAVSSTNITHVCLTPQNARVVPYSPERAMPESPVSQERHPLAKGQPRGRLVSAQALVARQQARAEAVTVAVPAVADGGHVCFSMIPRLVFSAYACPLSTRRRVALPRSTRVQVPVDKAMPPSRSHRIVANLLIRSDLRSHWLPARSLIDLRKRCSLVRSRQQR